MAMKLYLLNLKREEINIWHLFVGNWPFLPPFPPVYRKRAGCILKIRKYQAGDETLRRFNATENSTEWGEKFPGRETKVEKQYFPCFQKRFDFSISTLTTGAVTVATCLYCMVIAKVLRV